MSLAFGPAAAWAVDVFCGCGGAAGAEACGVVGAGVEVGAARLRFLEVERWDGRTVYFVVMRVCPIMWSASDMS